MPTVNIFDAKTNLSRLLESIETGNEVEIIIARNGRPVARLVPVGTLPHPSQRIGVARGAFEVPDDIDVTNMKIGSLFKGGDR